MITIVPSEVTEGMDIFFDDNNEEYTFVIKQTEKIESCNIPRETFLSIPWKDRIKTLNMCNEDKSKKEKKNDKNKWHWNLKNWLNKTKS